ncbi:MAG: NAD(P)-binding protein [Panacagrimonas sp.]
MPAQKIAVLGGGIGSLVTAFWVTETPDWAQRYDITIYQQGWRLGGKCASGRNLKPGHGKRIEEHGLHIWFGGYENAFRTYRVVLDRLRNLQNPPVQTFQHWHEAFQKHSLVVLGDNGPDGLEQWPLLFPENRREPGRGQHPEQAEMLVEMLRMGANFFEGRFGNEDSLEDWVEGFGLPNWATRGAWMLESAGWELVTKTARQIDKRLKDFPLGRIRAMDHLLATALRGLRELVRRALKSRVPHDVRARRIWVVNDMMTTLAIGILHDDLLNRGFESVDHEEFKDWLKRHGADPDITLKSSILRVLYDLMFAYRDGNEHTPELAAGTAARALLYIVAGYDGSIMYKMTSGMGDTVFTPLYGLLKARGVKFEFFHRVEKIQPDAAGNIVEIHCTRQVDLTPATLAAGGYAPLVRVGTHDTWPATPLFDQIVDGDLLAADPNNPGHPYNLESSWTGWPGAGMRVLKRGQDFDLVVCGIPVGELARIGSELADASPAWARMLRGPNRLGTVRTQAMQVWFRPTIEQMGWIEPERMREAARLGRARPLLGGYTQPFNTWCDMSQLLPPEDWDPNDPPRSLAYFCGQMPDDPSQPPASSHAYPLTQVAAVRATGKAWFDQFAQVLWPKAADPKTGYGLRANVMLSPPGTDPFDGQYFRANIDPTERYVLSLKNTTASRLKSHCTDFPNLYLAGDWTWNPVLNGGCVEAAVTSAMLAARALSGMTLSISGE